MSCKISSIRSRCGRSKSVTVTSTRSCEEVRQQIVDKRTSAVASRTRNCDNHCGMQLRVEDQIWMQDLE